MKSEDQFKYFEGGEDGAENFDVDQAVNPEEFEKKKEEQRQTIKCNLLKWLLLFGIICFISYQIMLAKNPYRIDNAALDPEVLPDDQF